MIKNATISPGTGSVGQFGTWSLSFAFQTDLAAGARVLVQLPDAWHTGEWNGAHGVHSSDARAPNYVSASVAGDPARVWCSVQEGTTDEVVKPNRPGLDGHPNRYVWVVDLEAIGDVLTDEAITVVFGDTTGGSPGFQAGFHPDPGQARIRLAVSSSPGDEAITVDPSLCPLLVLEPGPAVEVVATLPSIAVVGETAELHLVVFDEFGNRVTSHEGSAEIQPVPEWNLPQGAAFTPSDAGVVQLPITVEHVGILRVRVVADGMDAWSNPMRCHQDDPGVRLYWGDLHSHAEHSFDGVGSGPEIYARDTVALDFYARTEHSERWSNGVWNAIRASAAKYNEPGRFVTLVAYEATFGGPWGHHNVFFRGEDGPVLGADSATVLDLWDALDAGDAFTIPHHTGIGFTPQPAGNVPGNFDPNPDWRIFAGPGLRPSLEIYSLHGQSEKYDPDHPLSYENCPFSLSHSNNGPYYAQDGWRSGHALGVVSGSDNHRAQPGRGEGGLTAVWASSLDRSTIFDSVQQKRTYATTGARIILDFQLQGQRPGAVIRNAERLEAELAIHGTGSLESVELVRVSPLESKEEVVARWDDLDWDLEDSYVSDDRPLPGAYYLRVFQEGSYRGRRVMAWSTPVWLVNSNDTGWLREG